MPRENGFYCGLALLPYLRRAAQGGIPKGPVERKWRIDFETGSVCHPKDFRINTCYVRDAISYRRGKLRQDSSLHCNP